MSKAKHMFVVEAPPRKTSGRGAAARRLALKVAALKGQWVKIAEYDKYMTAHTRASDIRKGKLVGWSQVGSFEVKVRQIPTEDGGEAYGMWVRCTYVRKAVEDELDS